ncbi:proline-rich transmembrane protein 4 isoform X2 [Narcine bancroftii]|uniref:proline-rich transmembrane protein 4 isoform X2 n=1 Tax=Narcine bancroftii TaxID=1343680 RepID=UPI0038319252
MVMEYRDVQWAWVHYIICSSIIQAVTVSPPPAAADSLLGDDTTRVYSTIVHNVNSEPPSLSPQSLPELSTDEKLALPSHSGMFPWDQSTASRENSPDFSGEDEDLFFDDEDTEGKDNSDVEEDQQGIFESEQFSSGTGSVPSDVPAETSSTSDNSLKPGTAVDKTTQSHQSHVNSQSSRSMPDTSYLQTPTVTFPNDELFSHHMKIPLNKTVKTPPRPLATLENVNPTLTSDYLVSETHHFITNSYRSLAKGKPALEIEGNQNQYLIDLVPESPPVKQDQIFISRILDENHTTPAPMHSVSPLTGSSYSAMMSEKLLRVSQSAVRKDDLTDAVNETVPAETNTLRTDNLPMPFSENPVSRVRGKTTDQTYPSVKILGAADRMSTLQWTRMPVYNSGKFLPAQQTTHTHSTLEQGYDIYINSRDNTTTVIEMLKGTQFLNVRPTNIDQGFPVRGTSPIPMVTISPTARLQHLTMKGDSSGMSLTESTRAVTATYFFPLTAWRGGPSRESNSILDSATTLRTEQPPSGHYMAVLTARPTVLAQWLTARASNKVNVSMTRPPPSQEGLGTKSMSTNWSLPWATTKDPSPSPHSRKMPEARTTTKGGTVIERTSPHVTGTPGINSNVMTTMMGSQSGNDEPSVKMEFNSSTGINATSPKEQGPLERIPPIKALKPNQTANSNRTAGNRSDKISSDFELCPRQDKDCAFNKTISHWKDVKQNLGFAWEMHIYGAGVLFIALMVISLINLISSPILYIPDLGYLMAANAMLFILAFLRALYLLLDPYSSNVKLPLIGGLMLYNVTFPLLVTTFGTLTLLLLKGGSLQMLPSKFQSPALLSVIAALHIVVLISGDLLSLLVNPAVNVVLHVFSVSWASFLIMAFFLSYRKLQSRSEVAMRPIQKPVDCNEESVDHQNRGRTLRQLLISARVMALGAVFGFLCCALQVYATLWNYGLLGEKGRFYWAWWFLQFWYRSFEIAMSFAMSFVASYAFCQQHGRPDYTCLRKIVQYFHHYRKSEGPQYPNNCFDWSSGTQDRITSNVICKNLLCNRPECMPLKTVNGTHEAKPGKSYCSNNGSIMSLDHRPKIPVLGPKSHNLLMGRSFTSICIEKESALSLNEFDLRPPSPINLSRSIDEALFREHIVRDSLFNHSSLHYPSRLAMEDGCSSLRVHKARDQGGITLPPSDFTRRNSDPDCLYSMAQSDSLKNNQTDTSKQSVLDLNSNQASSRLHRSASGSTLDSISRTSFGIHWYTWTRERSSEESVPSADPASESLLSQDKSLDNPDVRLQAEDPDLEAEKSFVEIRVIDDVSLSSDTIEL